MLIRAQIRIRGIANVEQMGCVGLGWDAVELIVANACNLEALKRARRDVTTLVSYQNARLIFGRHHRRATRRLVKNWSGAEVDVSSSKTWIIGTKDAQ